MSSKNKLVEAKKRTYNVEDDPSFWDYIAQPFKKLTGRSIGLTYNSNIRNSEVKRNTSKHKKNTNNNSISKIYYYSTIGDFIREFEGYEAFQNFIDKNYESIDEESYFEFYDNFDSYEILTVKEIKRTSILSNLKNKIERSLLS